MRALQIMSALAQASRFAAFRALVGASEGHGVQRHRRRHLD